MKVNIENASAMRDPAMKPWLLDELVRNLKEMRDRSNAGDMQAAVTEFFEVFRFNDGVGVAALAAQPGSVGEPVLLPEAVGHAADALTHIIAAAQSAKVALDAGLPNGQPVHPASARLTWPLSTAMMAEEKLRKLLAAAPTEAKPAQQDKPHRWTTGTWTLTSPDGKTWQADSPLKCVSAEQRARIPADVALARIYAASAEPAQQDAVDAALTEEQANDIILGLKHCKTLETARAHLRAAISAKKGQP